MAKLAKKLCIHQTEFGTYIKRTAPFVRSVYVRSVPTLRLIMENFENKKNGCEVFHAHEGKVRGNCLKSV